MSEFDAILVDADSAIFGVFADVVTVKRGGGPAVSAQAVIDRDLEVLGEHGQVTGRVTKVSFRNADWRPKSGDIVTLPGGIQRKVDEVEADDAHVTRAVLYG